MRKQSSLFTIVGAFVLVFSFSSTVQSQVALLEDGQNALGLGGSLYYDFDGAGGFSGTFSALLLDRLDFSVTQGRLYPNSEDFVDSVLSQSFDVLIGTQNDDRKLVFLELGASRTEGDFSGSVSAGMVISF